MAKGIHRSRAPAHSTPSSARPARSGIRVEFAGVGVLIVLAAVHFAVRVDPTLRYHTLAPAFFVDAPFFARFSGGPGRLLDYGAAALAQLGWHGGLGTAAVAALWAAIYLLARRVLATANRAWAPIAAAVLVAILASLPGRYEPGDEGLLLGLIVALGLAAAWSSLPSQWRTAQISLAWLGGGAAFAVAGPLPLLLFTAVLVGLEIQNERRSWVPVFLVAMIGVIPFWVGFRPAFDPWSVIRSINDAEALILTVMVWTWVPAALVMLRLAPSVPGAPSKSSSWLAWTTTVALALVGMWLSLATGRRAGARVDYHATQHRWSEVLTAAQQADSVTPGMRLQVARALFHTGRLLDDLFTFPQRRGADWLAGQGVGPDARRVLSETLLELGQVNLAEHWAHETFELEGSRPETLRLLARINILLDRPAAARIFLNRLRLAPFRGAEARAALARLAADPVGMSDPELVLIRGRMPHNDQPESPLPADVLLRQLLAANATNTMAFHYLLATHLLAGDPARLAGELVRSARPFPVELPRACQEALLVLPASAEGEVVALRQRVSAGVRERRRRFAETYAPRAADAGSARAALAPEFGDTYWYYHLFGETARRDGSARR